MIILLVLRKDFISDNGTETDSISSCVNPYTYSRSRNIARYVRCDRLIPGFKAMLDDGTLTMAAGVDISYLPESEQIVVMDVMEQNGIRLSRETAKELRAASGSLTIEKTQSIFEVDKPAKKVVRAMSVVLPPQVYVRFFADVAVKDVQGIVEKALEKYFEGKGA